MNCYLSVSGTILLCAHFPSLILNKSHFHFQSSPVWQINLAIIIADAAMTRAYWWPRAFGCYLEENHFAQLHVLSPGILANGRGAGLSQVRAVSGVCWGLCGSFLCSMLLFTFLPQLLLIRTSWEASLNLRVCFSDNLTWNSCRIYVALWGLGSAPLWPYLVLSLFSEHAKLLVSTGIPPAVFSSFPLVLSPHCHMSSCFLSFKS